MIMLMKKLFPFLLLLLISCSLPSSAPQATATPAQIPTPTPTLQPTAQPGSDQNPFILALAPTTNPSAEMLEAGNQLAALLEKATGVRFRSVVSSSEKDIIKAFEIGNADVGILSPIAYTIAYNNQDVRAALASTRNAELFYGAQFITRTKDNFTSYYDPIRNENTTFDPFEALNQLKDKKPCWSDAASPSGYVIPLGLLNQAKIKLRDGAFVEGQTTVVRAIYAGGICDFGATYIDARTNPALESEYPDVFRQVEIIWQTPKVIPYEVIVVSSRMPADIERSLLRAFVDIMTNPETRPLVQTALGADELQIVQDAIYADFRKYLESSELDLSELIK